MLKCREELIGEKVAHERDCELLRSELGLLHTQTAMDEKSQQQMKVEISRLQEQLGRCSCFLLAVVLILSLWTFKLTAKMLFVLFLGCQKVHVN